ncbi:uncharacterized protein C3orf20-like isoform X2 [Notolabrus celidotus]|uniref:uncharacterized protein C3orf20-like isoform X2 n=1 Tax=Notolabrus celidotus TaxID=1203425 RepID=UPI0014905B23|nr:uncharacterized protein C3orf20-like isoform X2 [Notolabrus celidotus]
MTSPSRIAPLYFYDQPRKRNERKRKGSNILCLNMENGEAHMENNIQSPENVDNEANSDELPQRLSPETCEDDKPETSFKIKDYSRMDAYKQAAPHLLNELALLLSQHKWAEEGHIPQGIVNILNYSWKDLTAGVVLMESQEQTERRGKFKGPPELDEAGSGQMSAKDKREACSAVGSVSVAVIKPKVTSNPHMKKRKQNPNTAHNSTTFSFSFPSDSCKDPGWIIQPKQPSCDEPQRISLCQWVVERLQAARDPEKLQTAQQEHPLAVLHHYGDAKVEESRAKTKTRPTALVSGMPQIPEVKQQKHPQQKLHYKTNDGTSFIYYRSGCMAVCQSHSGLPCGGFYTNVFSDSECPVIMATLTAFGCGSITHPLSSAIKTMWDQDGGFMFDQYGNITKEWSWQEYHTLRKKIVLKVSDHITVRLFSGTSAIICFKCDGERVQLPLSALPYNNRSKRLMVREVEEVKEPSAQWRRAGHNGRDLKRLQQRARNIVEDWLDYYCVAVGIKCPSVERMPDALLRTRLRREVQSAVLPSVNPPEQADAKVVQPEDDRNELQKLHRHLSVPADRPADTCVKLPRAVIIPNSPDLQPSAVSCNPSPTPITPSCPLTVCPALLRAALRGEGGRKRCCCSTIVMPALTDLEYDAFIMGQPLYSQQILVVCVTSPHQPIKAHVEQHQVVLEQVYKRRNKHRTMPCTQCQMDSYRLLRYEMSTRRPDCEEGNILLQQRHNVAPGMVLMYIRWKLLFVGFIFSDHSHSVRDLENQISRTRGDYRLGLSLPTDYKFSDTAETSAEKDEHSSQDSLPKGGHDVTMAASVEKKKGNVRKYNQGSRHKQSDVCVKPKTTPALPHVPIFTHCSSDKFISV